MKRTLRKSINYILIINTMLLIAFIGIVDNFTLAGAPYVFGAVALIALNIYLLAKYGDSRILYED